MNLVTCCIFSEVHAIANAILNKNRISLEGCTLYTTKFPCTMCTHLILQSKISMVISISEINEIGTSNNRNARTMLQEKYEIHSVSDSDNSNSYSYTTSHKT